MIKNRKNLIARAFKKGGLYDFWKLEVDKGQDLEYGDFRIPAYRLTDSESMKFILKEEKKRLCACDSGRTPVCRLSRSEKTWSCAKKGKTKVTISF